MTFQNGVEFKLAIDGESWPQGSCLKGTLESKPKSEVQVYLAEGKDKKVKAKSPDAFVILQELKSKEAPFSWEFQLPLDTRISDNSGGLYILYGNHENFEKLGQLRLNIVPHQHIHDLIEVFTHHFRFALKNVLHAKGGNTEVKIDPPAIKEWAMLEQLILHLRLTETDLHAKFVFHRNEIDPGKGGISTVTVKREFSRTWEIKKIIHDFNQRLNKEIMTIEIEKVIAEYRNAGWLSS